MVTFFRSSAATKHVASAARPPIPILSVALSMDPKDFLSRLLRNIDYPIQEIHVLVGNSNSTEVARILSKAKKTVEKHPLHLQGRVTFRALAFNPGASGGTNAGMRMLQQHSMPWGIIVNSDIKFLPGSLARLQGHVRATLNRDPNFGVGFVNLFVDASWSAFVLTSLAVETVGYWDENLYPAYFEDDDYSRRLRLSGLSVKTFHDVNVTHGKIKNGALDYESGQVRNEKKLGAATWRPMMEMISRGSNSSNEYLRLKWGENPGTSCKTRLEILNCTSTYTAPFNNSALSLRFWALNSQRRAWIVYGGGPMPNFTRAF